MTLEPVRSPAAFLSLMLGPRPEAPFLRDYASWWETEGRPISDAVDRAGTPWLRMFDEFGHRVDEMLYTPDYRRMLEHGYRAGAVWRAFKERSMLPAYELGYITAFHDPGLYCPYTVSLSTAVVLEKYGDPALKARFLPQLLRQDDAVWQGGPG